MILHKGDAIIVLDLALAHVLGHADAVLRDVDGQMVATRHFNEATTQTVGVNLGAPLSRLHVGIVEHLLEPALDHHALGPLEGRAGIVHHELGLAIGIGPHEYARVVVETQEVDGTLAKRLKLIGRYIRKVKATVEVGEQIDGKLACSGGIENPVICVVVGESHGNLGLKGVIHAVDGPKAVHDADRTLITARAERLHAERRRIHDVERCMRALLGILQGGRIVTDEVPAHDEPLRLVEGRPIAHAVAEAIEADACIVLEGVRRLLVQPAALILPVLRKVPMVDGYEGLDTELMAGIDQAVVEGNAFLVDLTLAILDDAGPRERETIGVLATFRHGLDVLTVAVVVVARHIAILQIVFMQVAIPHRFGLPALLPGSFTLVGSGRAPPEKRCGSVHVPSLSPLPACRQHYDKWLRVADAIQLDKLANELAREIRGHEMVLGMNEHDVYRHVLAVCLLDQNLGLRIVRTQIGLIRLLHIVIARFEVALFGLVQRHERKALGLAGIGDERKRDELNILPPDLLRLHAPLFFRHAQFLSSPWAISRIITSKLRSSTMRFSEALPSRSPKRCMRSNHSLKPSSLITEST